jgi:hypothetical protein
MFNTGLCVMRPRFANLIANEAPFIMLKHSSTARNTKRFNQLSTALINQYTDGLENVKNKTKILDVVYYAAFTHLVVDFLN